MQHEFNSRIDAQRSILKTLNAIDWEEEELAGLSSRAIERWISVNRIDPSLKLVALVREASAKLFFLANKSQDQVSTEYRLASAEVIALKAAIERELKSA